MLSKFRVTEFKLYNVITKRNKNIDKDIEVVELYDPEADPNN